MSIISNYKQKKKCRVCGHTRLEKILDLGKTPLANAFLSKKDLKNKEERYPLVLVFCDKCFLVQLGHSVRSEILWKNYHYNTGASKPLVDHFMSMANEIRDNHLKSKNDLVVEFGSNDGSFLGALAQSHRVLGVDPAENVARMAKQKGIDTVTDYFGEKSAKKISEIHGQARVIVANNVFAHIDDIHDVLKGVDVLLSKNGRFIFECHWLGNLIGKGGFDQIYHEHLFYYSLHALRTLLSKWHLTVVDVKLVPIHGESLRVFVSKNGKENKAVKEFLEKEKEMGLTKKETFFDFREKVESNKQRLADLLTVFKQMGKKIVGYGAPGKSTTLLNYLKIGPETLDFITDTTSAKQGTFTPGTHIPILHPDVLKKEKTDYILLLSWNYTDTILKKEENLRMKGVKFIVPVPEVKIV